MTERERWIVYPLLLMTLGIVLRDKLVGATNLQAQRVTCDQLVIVDDNGREVAAVNGANAQRFVRGTWPLLDPRLHHSIEPAPPRDERQNDQTN